MHSSHSRAARFIFTPISTFRWTKLNYKMVQNWYFCLVLENQNKYKGDLTNVVLSLIFLFFKISKSHVIMFLLNFADKNFFMVVTCINIIHKYQWKLYKFYNSGRSELFPSVTGLFVREMKRKWWCRSTLWYKQ